MLSQNPNTSVTPRNTMVKRPEQRDPLIRRCRGCGCTDDHACTPPCSWVELDLCSACAEESK